MNDLKKSNKQRFGHEVISNKVKGIERIYSDANIRINNSHQLSVDVLSTQRGSPEFARNFELEC